MRQPTLIEFIAIISTSLAFAIAGLYLLANFGRLFKRAISNELLRKNAAVWLIIFCISGALSPMSNGFFYLLFTDGLGAVLLLQFLSTTAYTIFGFNAVWLVTELKWVQQLSFIKRAMLMVLTVVVMTIILNMPFIYFFYHKQLMLVSYSILSSIYLGGATGFVYALTNYLDIQRKRKFDEKELELSRLRELKTKAELDALHSKINPHFLYNSLNSIADLSVTDGRKARKMTIALSDLFRYSINYSNNNYSTVKDEVEMANVYLQIEKIRFEDKLNYSLQVEEELSHYLVPRFVLQPLVENAVKHGLKATGQMTEINLEVKKKGTGLVMNITDTGPLFPAELNPGYGVKSVFDKLDLLFPGNYEMRFSNEPVKQVSLHIYKLVKDESAI